MARGLDLQFYGRWRSHEQPISAASLVYSCTLALNRAGEPIHSRIIFGREPIWLPRAFGVDMNRTQVSSARVSVIPSHAMVINTSSLHHVDAT